MIEMAGTIFTCGNTDLEWCFRPHLYRSCASNFLSPIFFFCNVHVLMTETTLSYALLFFGQAFRPDLLNNLVNVCFAYSDTPLILEVPVVAAPAPPPSPTTSTTASCSTTVSSAIPQPPPPLVDEPSPALVEHYARRMAEKTAKPNSLKSSSVKSSILRPSSNIKASVQPTVRSIIGTAPSATSNPPSKYNIKFTHISVWDLHTPL